MKSRIYGEKARIDGKKVQQFFENRLVKDNPLATVMLRADTDAHIVEKRDANEAQILKKIIDFSAKRTILDIGCGCGRLASHFAQNINYYDGVDFSQPYIDVAKELFKQVNINFYQMSATNLDKNILNKSYDTVFITGLCVYLNDDDIQKMMLDTRELCTSNAKIYLRESVSVINNRLTLKDFPSQELDTEYNAIYRTPKEYEEMIGTNLPEAKILASELLLTEETGARKETNQQYWLIQL